MAFLKRFIVIVSILSITVVALFTLAPWSYEIHPLGATTTSKQDETQHSIYISPEINNEAGLAASSHQTPTAEDNGLRTWDYREIFSLTTRDRKFIPIFLAGMPGYNANILPHPSKSNFYIVVVQHEQKGQLVPGEELACEAGFLNGALICTETPVPLVLESSHSDHCDGELTVLGIVYGARDARVFYGPDRPYIMYGSQSNYICYGLWIQDARTVIDSFKLQRYMKQPNLFAVRTELQRPGNVTSGIEKNYFMFWDAEGRAYAHYNLWPTRSFAELNFDGTGFTDLGPVAANHDQICMAKFMPPDVRDLESIHQATNSLMITLCRRSDSKCVPDDGNTFIMHIFHHKSYYGFHGVYEAFVVLFQRSAPFAIHAISQRPLWIHGRGPLTFMSDATQYRDDPAAIPPGHPEMFYITSMSWKSHDQQYHGYIDDVVFLNFGIEDARPGLIDVHARDLLQDLAFCDGSPILG